MPELSGWQKVEQVFAFVIKYRHYRSFFFERNQYVELSISSAESIGNSEH